jgi:hypothetical protein
MNNDTPLDPFGLLIQTETEQLVLSYIVVGETYRPDGSKSLYVTARPEQSATTTIGLLRSALAIEEHRLARHFNRPPQ